MKKTILALLCFAGCAVQYSTMAAPSGPRDLPARVSSAFSRNYPGAKMDNWVMSTNDYVINFTTDKETSAAYYSPDGTWLRTNTKLSGINDLPVAVRSGLASSGYRKYSIDKMEKVRQPSNRTLYLVRVDYGGYIDWDLHDSFSNEYVLYFNPDGKLQKAVNIPDQMPTTPFASEE